MDRERQALPVIELDRQLHKKIFAHVLKEPDRRQPHVFQWTDALLDYIIAHWQGRALVEIDETWYRLTVEAVTLEHSNGETDGSAA